MQQQHATGRLNIVKGRKIRSSLSPKIAKPQKVETFDLMIESFELLLSVCCFDMLLV